MGGRGVSKLPKPLDKNRREHERLFTSGNAHGHIGLHNYPCREGDVMTPEQELKAENESLKAENAKLRETLNAMIELSAAHMKQQCELWKEAKR